MAFKFKEDAPLGGDGKEVMRTAISKILLFAPAHAATLSKMRLIEDPSCPSMKTDGKTIWWGPEFCAALTWQELGFVLMHEVDHRHLCHPWRFGQRDPYMWNIAGDARINVDLVAYCQAANLPFKKPADSGVWFDWVTPDMTTEAIYDIIEAKSGASGRPPPGQGQGDGKGEQQGAGFGNEEGELDMLPAPADAKEVDAISDLADATAMGKAMGLSPGHLVREMEQVKDRMVDWKSLLATKIRATIGFDDWTYRRARVSGMRNGVVMPTLGGNRVECVVVVIDTSGSHWHLTEQCFAEVRAVFQAVNPSRVIVIQTDTHITDLQEYTNASDVKLEAKGGGGSHFVEALEKADTYDASAVVFISDFEGQWPKEPVRNFIGVLVGHYGGRHSAPDWVDNIVEVRE
jgi:predicted metal-dependent peptidase